MQPIIKVRNLKKIYRVGKNKVRALDGVDLEIASGEFCAIVGTSGSGKSTLLNMLAGLESPTKGEIVLHDYSFIGRKEDELVRFRRDHVGFIFQSFNLIPSLTAWENVALPLTFQGIPAEQRAKRAKKILKEFGLGKHMYHKPTEMSGGQQQRVGIARALVVEPDIVFADEPTGNLDSKTSAEIMQIIRELAHKQKQTLIMVTHDDNLAEYADRIIRISDGKIIDDQRGNGHETKVI